MGVCGLMEKRLDGRGRSHTETIKQGGGKELTLTQLLLWRGCPVTAPFLLWRNCPVTAPFSPQDASQNRAGVPVSGTRS